MIKKKVLIFGASGQIGRNIIRKITLQNYKVTAVTRNAHKSIFLKTQAPLGYLDIVEENIFNEKGVRRGMRRIYIYIGKTTLHVRIHDF